MRFKGSRMLTLARVAISEWNVTFINLLSLGGIRHLDFIFLALHAINFFCEIDHRLVSLNDFFI